MKHKKVFVSLFAVAALVLAAGVYYVYWSHHPHVVIQRGETISSSRFDGEYHNETIMVAFAHHKDWIPLAKSVDANLKEFADWNNQVITDLNQYIAPYNIKVSGEVAGGKTTLRYAGYVTTQKGETIDYEEEKTFDFAYVSNEDLFQSNRLG